MKNLTFILMLFLLTFASCSEDPVTPVGEEITISEDIISNTIWNSGNIYHVVNSIDVTNNAVLTIEPGTIIKVDKDVEIDIASAGFGSILAKGTKEKPILFTSSAPNPIKGDWWGLWIYEGATGSEFAYCTFEYAGGYSNSQAAINIRDSKIRMDNCTIRESESYGIEIRYDGGGFTSFNDNNISGTIYEPIKTAANAVRDFGTGNTYDNNKRIEVANARIDLPGAHHWKKQGVPYFLADGLLVAATSGAELTLEAGCVLQFASDVEIGIGSGQETGSIQALGTPTNPVVFTSAFPSPSNGDWWGIWFYDGATTSKLDNCIISYGGGYSYGGNITLRNDVGDKVTISNCIISYSGQYGIYKQTGDSEPIHHDNTFFDNLNGDKNW